MKKLLIIMSLIFVVLAVNVNAAVTQSIGASNHSVDSDVVITITGAPSDKGDEGFYVFSNSTEQFNAMDDLSNLSFTIPSTSPFQTFVSWKVTANQSPQVNLSGNLFVEDVFISDVRFNTTSEGGVNILDIVDVETTTEIFEGKTAGIRGVVKNQGKLVGYADVCLDVLDENNEPFQHIGCKKSETDGQFFFSEKCDGTNWCNAGVSYVIDIDASCPINRSGTDKVCQTNDGKELNFANGGASKPITVVDLADKFIIKKWIDATETVQPGMGVFNEFTSKAQMRKNPNDNGGYLSQQDIDWGGFNNTNTSFTIEQNGEAYLTAGNTFTVYFIINNTFPDELEFDVFECTLDDDNKSQEIFPLDPITKQRFGSEVIAHLFAKPSSEVGLVQKFTPPLLLAFDFVGGNDFDVQCKIKVHGFEQELTPESDEFHLFGEVEGTDFVPIIDIKNLTTTAFNTKQNACTQINVTINYDYFGAIEEEFTAEYGFEMTDIDVVVKIINKLIKPDAGKNQNITDTFFLPFVDFSGNAEVAVEIFNKDDVVVGFGDTEPHNTFNITADLSDECRYQNTDDQFLQARQTRALENISTKTGTFHFAVIPPSKVEVGANNMEILIEIELEDGSVRKETDITCWVNGYADSTTINFNHMATDAGQVLKRTMNFPKVLGSHQVLCEAIYYNFGSRVDSASGSFTVVADIGSGSGSGRGGTTISLFQQSCNELAQEAQQCLTYSEFTSQCEAGCNAGFACNNDFKCIEVLKTGTPPSKIDELKDTVKDYAGAVTGFVMGNLMIVIFTGAFLIFIISESYDKKEKEKFFKKINKMFERKNEKNI